MANWTRLLASCLGLVFLGCDDGAEQAERTSPATAQPDQAASAGEPAPGDIPLVEGGERPNQGATAGGSTRAPSAFEPVDFGVIVRPTCLDAAEATCANQGPSEERLGDHLLRAAARCQGCSTHYRVEIDTNGCATRLFLEAEQIDTPFSRCVLGELQTQRFSCAAGTSQSRATACVAF